MDEKPSGCLGNLWNFPLIGENIVQPLFLFLPLTFLFLTGAFETRPFPHDINFAFSIIELVWLWALERFGGTRLVVPLIGLPWFWVLLGYSIYSGLVLAGVAEFSA